MKILGGIMIILAIIYFLPAVVRMNSGSELNGGSMEQLKKSAKMVRRNMSTTERNTFDIAFGLLEQLKGKDGPDAFAKIVDGKKPEELIELAKQEVNTAISTGNPDFKQYTSWDDMIQKVTALDHKKGDGQAPAPLRQSERSARPN